jgi:hypothetical protein
MMIFKGGEYTMNKFLILFALVFGVAVFASPAFATNNHCTWQFKNWHWVEVCTTPSPTPTVTPTATPEPSVTPTPEPECEVECEPTATPSATPEATPAPTEQPFRAPEPAYAPTLPACPLIEGWLPQVTYNGVTTENGNSVFHYTVKAVEEKNPIWWVKWGFTKDFMPYEKVFKTNNIDITMYGGNSNWINVSQYKEPGCFGLWSGAIN